MINVMIDSHKDRQYWSELNDEVGDYYGAMVGSVRDYLSAPHQSKARARPIGNK